MIYVGPMHEKTCDLWSDSRDPTDEIVAFLARAGLFGRDISFNPLRVRLTLADRFTAIQHGAKAVNQEQARQAMKRLAEREVSRG